MKKIYTLVFFLCSFSANLLHAQLLPVNQPEQDACNALLLCGNSFYTPYSYQGIGLVSDMSSTPCGGGEGNSVWLRLEVSGPGSIVFSIIPIDSTDDYDFAVVDATNDSCNTITSSDVVRCNFNNNLQPNPYYYGGIVGLNSTSALQTVFSGTYGSPFLQEITAGTGDVYLIMINNYGGNGGPSSGFTIDFSGSTATFVGDGTPQYDSLSAIPCSSVSSLTVYMNTSILCNSIAADGSDFQIVPPAATVTGATGLNCSGGNGYTQEVHLTFSNPVPGGSYTLMPNTGTDGNTLLDLCSEEQLLTDTISFHVAGPIVDLGPDTTTCIGDSLQLHAEVTGDGLNSSQIIWTPSTYLNNTGILDPVSRPASDIYYVFTVTPTDRPECFAQDTIHISVLQGFDLLNTDTAICIGNHVALNINGDNRYHYSWTPSAGLSDSLIPNPIAAPDTTTLYTITGSYPGCTDTSQSVIITVDTSVPSFIYFTMDQDKICTGETIHFTPYIDAGLTQVAWDFGDGSSTLTPFGIVQHAYDHPGVMPVKITASFLACPDTSFIDTVNVYPYPLVDLGPDSALCLDGQPIILANHAVNPSGIYRYLWNTGDTTTTLKVVHQGHYSLRMIADHDCATTEEVTISKDCYIDIPNAFTPDGDGVNDYFFPRQLLSKSMIRFHMQIFNRWGQMIFETEAKDGRGWDGMFNGKPQPDGVYLYLISADFNGSRKEHYNGNVTLIR